MSLIARHQNGPARVARWKIRSQTLSVERIPLLMGILNVTPDSFSDGGQFYDPDVAVEHGLRLADEGADILDVGGESTRPSSKPIDADEELRRVLPVVTALCRQTDVPVSIDTSKSAIARAALDVGAEVINDVSGFSADPEMISLAVESGAGICVMHAQGTPRTMQKNPTYDDVVAEILEYLRARRDTLTSAGVDRERISLDPGIGFGKTTGHNLTLLRESGRFHELGCPILIGHSRKSFVRQVLEDPNADPTAGTLGVTLALTRRGIQILRVHDVGMTRQALVLFEASGGLDDFGG